MVELTRLNDSKIFINPYLVEMLESTPDTIIIMNSGKKYLVKEHPIDIEKKFSNFLAGSIYKAIAHSGVKLNTSSIDSPHKKTEG